MSKITNDGSTRSGTGCFIAVPVWQQWASKGWFTSLVSVTYSTLHSHKSPTVYCEPHIEAQPRRVTGQSTCELNATWSVSTAANWAMAAGWLALSLVVIFYHFSSKIQTNVKHKVTSKPQNFIWKKSTSLLILLKGKFTVISWNPVQQRWQPYTQPPWTLYALYGNIFRVHSIILHVKMAWSNVINR